MSDKLPVSVSEQPSCYRFRFPEGVLSSFDGEHVATSLRKLFISQRVLTHENLITSVKIDVGTGKDDARADAIIFYPRVCNANGKLYHDRALEFLTRNDQVVTKVLSPRERKCATGKNVLFTKIKLHFSQEILGRDKIVNSRPKKLTGRGSCNDLHSDRVRASAPKGYPRCILQLPPPFIGNNLERSVNFDSTVIPSLNH